MLRQEKRKLEIARSLIKEPKLSCWTSPSVRSIRSRLRIFGEVASERGFGKSVLITDHNVAQTLRVATGR